jgi:hypothetical protein
MNQFNVRVQHLAIAPIEDFLRRLLGLHHGAAPVGNISGTNEFLENDIEWQTIGGRFGFNFQFDFLAGNRASARQAQMPQIITGVI